MSAVFAVPSGYRSGLSGRLRGEYPGGLGVLEAAPA